MPAQPFGRYTLEHLLAVGGMGEVYVAVDHGTGGAGSAYQKPCVIKRILPHLSNSPERVAMFSREAALAAQLTHSNVVQTYDHGLVDGHYFMAMEYVEGLDLKGFQDVHRAAGRPVPLGELVHVGACVARALDYAHRARSRDGRPLGIVHRDVSPQNVLLSVEGDVKLTDFGVVKTAGDEAGTLTGKIAYLSPEQASGQDVDGRSDVFSLGIVLFEALTGRHPFRQEGDSGLAVMDRIKRGDVAAPSAVRGEIPASLDAVVVRCLARDPADRFPTAGALLDALEQVRVEAFPQAGAASLARHLRATCPPPVVPPAVAKATGAFKAALATQEAAAPVARVAPVDSTPPKPTVAERARGPSSERPRQPSAPRLDPVDDELDPLDAAAIRPWFKSPGFLAVLALALIAGIAALVAYQLHLSNAPPEALVAPPPRTVAPPATREPRSAPRPVAPLRTPRPRPAATGDRTAAPSDRPVVQDVAPEPAAPEEPADIPPPSLPAPSVSAPPPVAPVAELPVPEVPASPGLPPATGLRFNATRKLEVRVDGQDALEAIQGALDLDERPHVVKLGVPGGTVTLYVGEASASGRIMRAEASMPARVEVDGQSRGRTPLRPFTAPPRGAVVGFAGPGFGVAVSVR